ncbi:organic solvent tolerance protein OstA [Methylobacterium sp. C25]|uniref:LptA/OstA family protein n=1 Tax=Methylobacterium sp. C25 TaxID=2721622 RepID=UPI001F30CBD2|nr:LptA/OstA family protein [Methylobacterium sp. C25]MCE4223048.1 organic solvent tolerance protein OstA [Methylobacterium sp. C25]
MSVRVISLALALGVALAPLSVPALAKDKADSPMGALGGNGKEPIKIDADRLDVFDKENKAIFAGNVVAVQGDATIRCSALTVFYKRGKNDAKDGSDSAGKTQAEMAENGIRKVDCAGPVTVVQKDQVATGDNATFDQVARRIVLTGNVVLSQCRNVTRGSRLVYDMDSGRANMDPGSNGRVSAMFVPGEKPDANGGGKASSKGCQQPPAATAGKQKPTEAAAPPPERPAGDKSAPKTRAQAN